jgi:cobalt-zinc-cadmium efflux system outer membrane protein
VLALPCRFGFGSTVGNIKAAKTGLQIAEQQTQVQQQQLTADLQMAVSDYTSAQQAVSYYETSGLRQADDIISAAKRFFESGQTDYIAYIRNINDAYAVKRTYLETLRTYNQSIININYITGDL